MSKAAVKKAPKAAATKTAVLKVTAKGAVTSSAHTGVRERAPRVGSDRGSRAAAVAPTQVRSSVGLLDIPFRITSVASAVGGLSKAADLLEVSKSQPTRWKQGHEQPSPPVARLLLDLDHVMARAQLVFTPKVARHWLTGSNSYLDGARPIDVLRKRGSTEVIDALDAALQGSYS